MIERKKRPKRKELRFPAIVIKSTYPSGDDVFSEFSFDKNQFNKLTDMRRFGRLDVNSHLCFSERGPRPKPEREWSPMSNKDQAFTQIPKYGTVGLYSKKVDSLYKILTRQNSIILPPIQTSRRVKNSVYDDAKMKEKRYVMKDFFTEGKMSKFERDQCYVPSVYSQYLNCKTCKKSYMNGKYIEEYKKRNHRFPNCSNAPVTKKIHFCDVLGKRYCGACIEYENRLFSRQIEERLQSSVRDSSSTLTDLCSDF